MLRKGRKFQDQSGQDPLGLPDPDKMVVANQLDIVVVDQLYKKTVDEDVRIPSKSRKKEHKKLKEYQGLKEELKRMWGVNASVVSVVIGAPGAVTPKLGEWLQ